MKKLVWLLVLLFVGLGIYVFLVPYEYTVTFRSKALPGTINQTVKLWNRSLENGVINQESIHSFEQRITVADRAYLFKWRITSASDSTSRVKVYISEPGNGIRNKLLIPLTETQLEKDAEQTVREFYSRLREHLGKFKVQIEGLSETRPAYCVYVPIETDQLSKANGMMMNYSLLDGFIVKNELETDGQPFIEVTGWDPETDRLAYNFCYPIVKTDSLPSDDRLKYKQLESKKAIKAIYNGNYITSDRAWYALKNYAEENDIETVDLPIEVFYNNPNFGSNEIEWKAEIFLPIK